MTKELKLLLSIATVSVGTTVALAIPSKDRIEKNKLEKEIKKIEDRIKDKKHPLSEGKINKLKKEITKAKEVLKKSKDISLIISTKDNFIKTTSAIINSNEIIPWMHINPINKNEISKLEKKSAEITGILFDNPYNKEIEKAKRDKEILPKIYNDSASGLDIDIHWTKEELERYVYKFLWYLKKTKLDAIKSAKLTGELFNILTKQIDKKNIEKAEAADLEKQQKWVDAYLEEIKKLNEEITKDIVSELIKEIKARMYRDSVSGLDIELHPSSKDIEKENKRLDDKVKEILDKNWNDNRVIWNEIFASSDTKKLFDDTYADLTKDALDRYKKHLDTHINESVKLTGELMEIWSSEAAIEKPKPKPAPDPIEDPDPSSPSDDESSTVGEKEEEIVSNLGNALLKNQGDKNYSKMVHWILDGNHNLWYDRTTKHILIAKKGIIPLGDSYSGDRYEFLKLTNDAYNQLIKNIDGERQLVNATKPTYKKGEYTNLSAMLDYKILNKSEFTDENTSSVTVTFDLEVTYKVGKFVFNGSPIVSESENKSTISIEYTFTKDGTDDEIDEPQPDDGNEETPPNDGTPPRNDDSSSPSDDDSETPPSNPPTDNISLGNGEFKLGHWNILKFTGNDNQKDKTKRIALLSEKEKFDILGLTEVKNPNGVKNIVDEMNKLSPSNMYSYIVSNKEKGSMFNRGSDEAVAIIYNKHKFEPIEFSNGSKGYSYKEIFTDFLDNENAEYARPPYGVQFRYKLKPDKKMTFVFDHFDGPGAKDDLGENMLNGMGTFEYREAKHLEKVLEYFKNISDKEASIFFGGDTNIPLGKEKLAFDWLKRNGGSSGYEAVFDDAHRHRSSLGRKGENYTNPYDKIFYKSNFALIDKQVFDLYKVVKDQEIRKLFRKHNVEIKDTKDIWKPGVLSDHTYISATFKIA
ncbi:Hypothetical protein, predicted membrane nuclease [Metamycoplasma auris 15026]|uniref:Endonuclease/exonuclease/phosphatase domain-containing protein n=1 Tax=Metamycoplasma auris 15026 TaxID=1188233 RepID=N9VCU5_9BACT|nr:hypothetical protein [Metamycoplasma auris]ENY69201.1 Hypothetical protein, predicted membrane nuclease [Metamycoplasma auris 15026]